MRRTILFLRELWRAWLLYRHNKRVMYAKALDLARYYTNLGVKCDEQTHLSAQAEPEPSQGVELNPFIRYKLLNERLNHAGDVYQGGWIGPAQQPEHGGDSDDSGGGIQEYSSDVLHGLGGGGSDGLDDERGHAGTVDRG